MASEVSTAGAQQDLRRRVADLERELGEAHQREAATAELLQVINCPQFVLQSVFDAIAQSAVRLCEAEFAFVLRFDRELLSFAAAHGLTPEGVAAWRKELPTPAGEDTAIGRAILQRAVVQIPDVQADPAFGLPALAQMVTYRSLMAVPFLRDGHPIGGIAVGRAQAGAFSEGQIRILRNFADQAVIAIENTRLFEEVQARTRELTQSLEYQTATSEVLSVISRSPTTLQPVLLSIATTAARLCDCLDAQVYRLDGARLKMVGQHGSLPSTAVKDELPLTRGSVTGRAVVDRRTVHVEDIAAVLESEYPDAKPSQLVVGHRTTLATPLLREGEPLGAILLRRTEVRPFSPQQIALLQTFADQAVIAIENTRLFEEVQARTRELARTVEDLEIASQHKSKFVANMSHELRTPLAAILGYAELMQEGFYEPQGPKSLDALTRIRSNGRHLLGLINTVLDIAKIESGQFTLNMAEYALESVVETVRSATESLAQNKNLALKTEVAKSLPIGLGDEQRLTQVLFNLVGNAIKFTDVGEVRVTAKAVNGHFAVTVADTGPGIPKQERTKIFDQFHQIDSSLTKAKGGTGLGLAIAKQIVEMHGGRIWVESTLGKGSTFQMELPTRAEFRKSAP